MPCSDSSSSMTIMLDADEKFVSFEYAKITCGQAIDTETDLKSFFKGKVLMEILQIPFTEIQNALKPKDDESQFILYAQWDALRAAIAQYLGYDDIHIDRERCTITSVEYTEKGIEIAEVILPPKELPKILPCSLGNQNQEEGSV